MIGTTRAFVLMLAMAAGQTPLAASAQHTQHDLSASETVGAVEKGPTLPRPPVSQGIPCETGSLRVGVSFRPQPDPATSGAFFNSPGR